MRVAHRPGRYSPAVRPDLYLYVIPILMCTLVHWRAWGMWFYLDDFAWLGLRFEVHAPRDLLSVLFVPEAQGTVRTLSERLFFLILSSLFGLNAIPFRIAVFLTQCANIVLLYQIARRLTGSRMAAVLASVFWTTNAGLALPLAWTSAYNEILVSFFVLLAFRFLQLYLDTGKPAYWVGQWIAFLLGFGALELNTVYPALALGYVLCTDRSHVRKTLSLFIPSILFAAVHFLVIGHASADPSYKMVFGRNVFGALWHYWSYMIGAVRRPPIDWRPAWLGRSLVAAVTLALLVFVLHKLRKGQRLPLFALLWFPVVLAPVLPLKNHFTEYYVTVPGIGIAILGGWALAESRRLTLAMAIFLAGACLTVSIVDVQATQHYYYQRTRRYQKIVNTVDALHHSHPDTVFLFSGIDNETFWLCFYGDPFRLIGSPRVYLTPGSEARIDAHSDPGTVARFTIPLEETMRLSRANHLQVFSLEGDTLREITPQNRGKYW